MSRSGYLALLNAYEQHVGVDRSAPGLAQTEELIIDGRVVSLSLTPDDLFPENGMVICRVDVARITKWPADELFRLLMQANNLWAGTTGSTLGLRGDDILMMSLARRVGSLDVTTFQSMVNTLINDADNWAARLTGKSGSKPAQPATPDMQQMLHMRA